MKFDVVIIGGGMVGAALACALKPLSLQVALVDAAEKTMTDDPRLIALNYGSICLLKNLHVFEKLTPYAAAIHEVHVSHRGHFGSVRIKADELNLSSLGAVIPAKNINLALEDVMQQASVQFIRPAKLIALIEEKNNIHLTLETPTGKKSIEAAVVVAADGSYSTVRNLLAVPTEKHDYKQSALVTIVELKRSHRGIAYERFLSDGAVAMLPLTGDRCASIWTASQEKITSLMQLSDLDFLQQLQKEFGLRLGRLSSVAERFVFPLQLIQAKKSAHSRIVLIGNAAHTVHPLAAQGFNLALHEVAELAQMLGEKPFDQLDLQEFTQHSFSQALNMKLSDGLNSLFAIDFLPINIMRQIGIVGMGIFGILKNRFAAYPVGRSGRIPQLLLDQENA